MPKLSPPLPDRRVWLWPDALRQTFDNVWEAQETNYIYLFAQTVAEWQAQPLVPPPINLLSDHECYVPGGWFIAGGDESAIGGLGHERVWDVRRSACRNKKERERGS